MKKWENPELKNLSLGETKTNICPECLNDLDAPVEYSLTEEQLLWWPHKPGCGQGGQGSQNPPTTQS